jgi:katanin p60 ATPase-containing subunit A1
MMSGTRADHESRLNEERRRAERGKHLVVLMLNHLLQMGYTGSVDALQSESGLSLSQYEAADNVDLVSILQEWEDYYEMRFQRRAKVVKKLSSYSDRVDPHGAKVGAPHSC